MLAPADDGSDPSPVVLRDFARDLAMEAVAVRALTAGLENGRGRWPGLTGPFRDRFDDAAGRWTRRLEDAAGSLDAIEQRLRRQADEIESHSSVR